MGIQDLLIGKLKTKSDDVSRSTDYQKGLLKTFSFTSVGGGSGSSTLLLYIAQYLAKDLGKQVVVLDLNFLQPDLLYNMKVEVRKENSILNYLKGSSRLNECFVQDENISGLKLVTASPSDDVELVMNLKTDENVIGDLIDKLGAFDYVLINLPYVKVFSTFIESSFVIDRGYLVMDDRLSNIKKMEEVLDFTHKYLDRGNIFNNIVLNKRSKTAYPYTKLNTDLARIVAEVPYDDRVVEVSNTLASLVDAQLSKDWFEGVSDLVENLVNA